MDTALYPLKTSLHGRERRTLRKIDKCDLQAAVKYGTKTRAEYNDPKTGLPRWKYEFKDVVYITDYTCTVEVTSYIKPIEIAFIETTEEELSSHERLSNDIRCNPLLCTSHTIFIVDQSGSMRTCDVDNFKTRSQAVYGTLLLDFLEPQLCTGVLSTDVVSLIEMKDEATVLIEREPLTKVLFNKILRRQKESRPSSHGNYIPSIKTAIELLKPDRSNSQCALLVLFVSDGRPSDAYTGRGIVGYCSTVQEDLAQLLQPLAFYFGRQLNFGALGFAAEGTDFTALKGMAESVTRGGARAVYQFSDLDSGLLATSLINMGTQLTKTKAHMTVVGLSPSRVARPMKWELDNFSGASSSIYDVGWKIHSYNVKLMEYVHKYEKDPVRRAKIKDIDHWRPRPPLTAGALGFVVRDRICGQGEERIVYELREIKEVRPGVYDFIGPRLVAKDNRWKEEGIVRKLHFHTTFCSTQQECKKLAEKFNQKVKERFSKSPARIVFLDCFVYTFPEREPGTDKVTLHGLLVEKMLDVGRDQRNYKKWNNNNGTVADTGNTFSNIYTQPSHELSALDEIAEEDDDDGSDFSGSDDDVDTTLATSLAKLSMSSAVTRGSMPLKDVINVVSTEYVLDPSEFCQAFSHWTYRYRKRRLLVCDLQGVLNNSLNPPVFELTDPVIHYRSKTGRRNVFGRTDNGTTGMNQFFKTHRCGAVCRKLGIASFIPSHV